jgi:hypothetical protein
VLLHEQAREHGVSVFFHPLVEQRPDFLAEIGGMGETGEFIALQRVTRGRQEELPGRLGWGTGHRRLPEEHLDLNSLVIHVNGTQSVPAVESCGKFSPFDHSSKIRGGSRQFCGNRSVAKAPATIRACSACAGDYEDPDRTAWTLDENEDEGGKTDREPSAEELPAKK